MQMYFPVADPDLQIKGGGGGGQPDPEIRGGSLQKKFFWPFGPQFGLKIRGTAGLPVPSPGSTTVSNHLWVEGSNDWKYVWV